MADKKSKKRYVDNGWPAHLDGDEHAVSELASNRTGALSPFGDLTFPLPLDEVPYVHPVTVINKQVTARPDRLSHVDESGAAHMVDVGAKDPTRREAVAAGTVHTRADVVALIASGGLPKGDALATARIAGIMAAKKTSELIPLCHQLALTGVDIDFEIGEAQIGVTATVRTTDRTGVEMEALTAVSVAALTVYDMIKAVDPAARIDDIAVLRKEGGKTGSWTRP